MPNFGRRYEPVRRLGEGAQGAVYLVNDRHLGGRLVALKSLLPEATRKWRRLFRREFEVLAGLRHPRLAQVHDFGTWPDGRVYFTRDYVVGDSLQAVGAHGDIKELVGLAVEICRSLRPLHRLGLVHGDLKPGNIIAKPDGTVHLIDFSFVRSAAGEDSQRAGTVPYMAPELIEGGVGDGRADLYALGATLFEISTGRAPFSGDSPKEIAQKHLSSERPRLTAAEIRLTDDTRVEIIEGFCAVVDRLLARSPDERYPDVYELEAALSGLIPGQVPAYPHPDHPMVDEVIERREVRDAVVSAVKERLDGAPKSSPLFVVEGELGTGKSEILHATKWWAQLKNICVVEASPTGPSHLREWLRDFVEQLMAAAQGDDDLLTSGRRLESLLLGLDTADVDLSGLVAQIVRFVSKLAASRPLLLLVDEVEQLSAERIQLLRGLIAGIEPDTSAAILAAALSTFPWREKIAPGRAFETPVLSKEEVSRLVEAFTGQAAKEVVERLYEHTGGNPLFVRNLLIDASASSRPLEQLHKLGRPRQLEEYWAARLDVLSETQRLVLEAASILGREVSAEQIGAVTGEGGFDVETTCAALENDGWLRRGPGGWSVATSSLREQVWEAVEPGRAEKMHARAFALASEETARLHHAAHAGDSSFVRKHGHAAVRGLERMGALQAARDLLETMIALGRDEPFADQLRLDLGRICLDQGDYSEAADNLQRMADHENPQMRRAALLLLGRLHSVLSELDAARSALEEALRIGGDVADEARGLRDLANVEFKRGDLGACEESARRGLDVASVGDAVRADIFGVLAKAAARRGDHERARRLARQAVEQAELCGDKRTWALALEILAWVAQFGGDLGAATEGLEQAVSLNREIGDLPRLMRDLLTLGTLRLWLESWAAALTVLEEASRLAKALSNPAQRVEVCAVLALALTKVGRFEKAGLVIEEAYGLLEQMPDSGELRRKIELCEANLLGARGCIEEAIARYQGVIPSWEARGRISLVAEVELEMAAWRLWRDADGDIACAERLIDTAAAREREEEGRRFEERLSLQRGALLVAQDRTEEGMAQLDTLSERCDEVGLRDFAWQAHLIAARVHIDKDNAFNARRRLRQAEKILDGLADGLSSEHKLAFWQDVRRAEVRRLLTQTAPEPSQAWSSSSLGVQVRPVDSEAELLYRVLELNKQLLTQGDVDRLLGAILDSAVELTRAERGFLLMHGPEGLEIEAVHGPALGDDAHGRFSRSIAESVFLDGEPVITVDAMGDERFNEFVSIHELQLRSVACFPVIFRGEGLGVLYLENRLRTGRFGASDLRVLSAFADQVAIAISQARLIERERRRQKELEEAQRALEEAFCKQQADLSAKKVDLELTRERLARARSQLKESGDYHGVIGTGPTMKRVFSLIERIKDLDVPVVFVGASGTGKDLLARVMHDASSRSRGPFVAVNCGSVPETLVEATLFGNVRGAFSGATHDRPGIIATANKGSLYLDDIQDMSPRMQVDLLRFLQEGSYTPLGGGEQIRADVRLIVSSKMPLQNLVEDGLLREDLRYRLEVVTVTLPPLKDRPEDLPLLASRILDREADNTGRPRRGLTREAHDRLTDHDWPGNVRELEQSLRRAVIIGEDLEPITADEIFGATPRKAFKEALENKSRGDLDDDDRARIVEALERCKWNRTLAAKELGMPRRTFYRRLEKLGLLRKR